MAFRRKLQVDILTLYLTLMLTSFAFIIGFTYIKNAKTVTDVAKQLIQEVSVAITSKFNDIIRDAAREVTTSSTIVLSASDVSLKNAELLNYMYQTLFSFTDLDSLYFATKDGNFLEYYRLPENAGYENDPSKLVPKDYAFAIHYLDRTVTPPTEVWIYQNSEGKVLETIHIDNIEYEPRDRPWYKQAVKIYKLYWTDVYAFHETYQIGTEETEQRGITASMPIFDNDYKFIGVVGIDLSLNFMSRFLEQQHMGKTGKAYIIDYQGNAIIAPGLQNKIQDKAPLSEPFKTAFEQFTIERKPTFVFEYNDVRYMAAFSPLHPILEKTWLIEIVVPVNDFLYEVIATHGKILLFSTLIVVITSFFVTYFSRRISRPIVKLAKKIDDIRQLNLEGDIGVHSNIKEIELMATSLASMKSALSAFGHYVPQEIVKQLMVQGKEALLGGERKNVTLFFTDIYNFSAIAEKMTAEEVMNQLSEYFGPLSQIVLSSKGTIDKYIGDCIMAFWGAPVDVPDHSFFACRCALVCQKKLLDLNKKWKEEKKSELITRIGLHEGDVIIGNIGTLERMNYTAIGDAVNVAFRIEEINKVYHTKIIVTEAVYKKVADRFVFRPLDIITLKGIEHAIKIYELLGQVDDRELAATPEDMAFASEFTKALEIYFQRKWQEALLLFQALHNKFPSDQPTAIYVERCKENLQHPPGADWTGVMHYTTK